MKFILKKIWLINSFDKPDIMFHLPTNVETQSFTHFMKANYPTISPGINSIHMTANSVCVGFASVEQMAVKSESLLCVQVESLFFAKANRKMKEFKTVVALAVIYIILIPLK